MHTPVTTTTPLLLQSSVLKCPHGFSTRNGGVSTGMFSTLNFGNPGDLLEGRDSPANIRANFQRVLNAVGIAERQIIQVHQVHGNLVHIVKAGHSVNPETPDIKADAIVTNDPRFVVAVRVADCAPILLESTDGSIVAAVHAGWRGAVSGVLTAAVEAMRELGATEIHAAIGPCIGAAAFEVGPEVLVAFDMRFGADRGITAAHPTGKGAVNLKRALEIELANAGVKHVETLANCTVSEPQVFFSHRRDRGLTGRMIGFIGPRGT